MVKLSLSMLSRKFLRHIKSQISTTLNLPQFYSRESFSQEGEDLILSTIFSINLKGFYVDVGAHHPFRYSNTFLLYRRGWHGINIDPSEESMNLFKKSRKRDINLCLAIDAKISKRKYYRFEDSAFNTLSLPRAKSVTKSGQSKLLPTKTVKTCTLANTLNKYCEQNIDLLNIDVEGTEMQVLKSNNWMLYKPKVVVVENIKKDSTISKYLNDLDYNLIARTSMTEIYRQGKAV